MGRISSSCSTAVEKKLREKSGAAAMASKAQIMPRLRKWRTRSWFASGASAAVRRSARTRLVASTSSSSKICKVASAARQRIAGVRVRMQEAARDVGAVKGLIDFFPRHHQRQRQVAAADALRQAQEIGPDRGLFAGEEGAGAAAADGDFVEDHVDLVAVAQFAYQL